MGKMRIHKSKLDQHSSPEPWRFDLLLLLITSPYIAPCMGAYLLSLSAPLPPRPQTQPHRAPHMTHSDLTLSQPAGRMGKMRIHKSGRVTLKLGAVTLNPNPQTVNPKSKLWILNAPSTLNLKPNRPNPKP